MSKIIANRFDRRESLPFVTKYIAIKISLENTKILTSPLNCDNPFSRSTMSDVLVGVLENHRCRSVVTGVSAFGAVFTGSAQGRPQLGFRLDRGAGWDMDRISVLAFIIDGERR